MARQRPGAVARRRKDGTLVYSTQDMRRMGSNGGKQRKKALHGRRLVQASRPQGEEA